MHWRSEYLQRRISWRHRRTRDPRQRWQPLALFPQTARPGATRSGTPSMSPTPRSHRSARRQAQAIPGLGPRTPAEHWRPGHRSNHRAPLRRRRRCQRWPTQGPRCESVRCEWEEEVEKRCHHRRNADCPSCVASMTSLPTADEHQVDDQSSLMSVSPASR
jgi:hypothetical protein